MKDYSEDAISFPQQKDSNMNDYPSHKIHSLLGGFAGMLMETILHPMDTIRTRMKSNACEFLTFNQTVRRMYLKEGPISFFSGFSCTLSGSFLSSATYFYSYEKIKHYLKSLNKYPEDCVPFVSAFLGGLCQDIIYIPCDIVRTRMQLENRQYDYNNILDGLRKIVIREGPAKLYLGGPAFFALNLLHTSLTFGFYEIFSKKYRVLFGKAENSKDVDLRIAMISSVTGASLSAVLTNPLDVVVTRSQMVNTLNQKPMGIIDNLKLIYKKEGLPGYMKGYSGRVLYYSCSAFILFPTYEFLKDCFGVDLLVDDF